MMKKECFFEKKKRFHHFKSLLYGNGKAQKMPMETGRLVCFCSYVIWESTEFSMKNIAPLKQMVALPTKRMNKAKQPSNQKTASVLAVGRHTFKELLCQKKFRKATELKPGLVDTSIRTVLVFEIKLLLMLKTILQKFKKNVTFTLNNSCSDFAERVSKNLSRTRI